MSQESPAPAPDRPVRLGKYEVLEHLASGGMAAIYRARDAEWHHEVALKVLPHELAANPVALKRFEREARAAAKLHHENIVSVYELGEAGETQFIAMEYVNGTDLSRYLQQRGRLGIAEALDIVAQAARALDHAHQHGIVHRDVKPSNLLLAPKPRETETAKRRTPPNRERERAGPLPYGRGSATADRWLVKLTDLGLAMDQLDHESRLTRPGTTLGTVDYMAPEQARGGEPVDSRSDIYGLGCTFYHMLTGRPPFPSGTITEKLYKHVHVMPDDPRDSNPRIPDAVIVILGRMLEKKPDDRYQTPAALLEEVEKLRQFYASHPERLPAEAARDEAPIAAAVEASPQRPRAKGLIQPASASSEEVVVGIPESASEVTLRRPFWLESPVLVVIGMIVVLILVMLIFLL